MTFITLSLQIYNYGCNHTGNQILHSNMIFEYCMHITYINTDIYQYISKHTAQVVYMNTYI